MEEEEKINKYKYIYQENVWITLAPFIYLVFEKVLNKNHHIVPRIYSISEKV